MEDHHPDLTHSDGPAHSDRQQRPENNAARGWVKLLTTGVVLLACIELIWMSLDQWVWYEPSLHSGLWHQTVTILAGVGCFITAWVGLGFRRIFFTSMAATELRLRAEIAEHERAEQRLRERENMMHKVFDAAKDKMIVTRLSDGKIIEVNAEFSSNGYSYGEATQSSVSQLALWRDPEDRRKYLDQIRTQGVVRNMEAEFRRKDGTIITQLISGALVELNGEQCVVSATRDISSLKQVQRELIAARKAALDASRAKSEFLSSMSHEIRTPMNAVLGMADLIAETELDPEQRKYLNIMTNNGNALLQLINDILDLAKVEAGRIDLETAAFDLAEVTDRVCETLAARAHSKHLELACHIVPGTAANLIGDPARLRQILVNLVGNAIKFTDSGSIVISAEQETQEDGSVVLHFSVADTGIGIAEDKKDKIFESFTQADSSTTRKYGGTGLGLTIVRRLIELMGGKIWVESELGKGSTFHFTAGFKLQSGSSAHAGSAIAPLDLTGVRTLIVDDTPVNRVILREMLNAKAAVIAEAESGPQALSMIEQARANGQPFQLLVLDCRMPGMDGLEVARTVKAATDWCGMVTLMLTSDDFSVRTAALRSIGIQSCLVKPIRRAELYQAIAKAISGTAGVKSSAPVPEQSRAATQEQSATQPALRILLVEDSPDNRLLITAYLKGTPHQLETAENGEIAIQKVSSSRYDLILMDMQMPVMDGYTATRAIRKLESEHGTRRSPIIALTASALKEDQLDSLDAGCDLHVAKPVKKVTLLKAIRDALKPACREGAEPRLAASPQPVKTGQDSAA